MNKLPIAILSSNFHSTLTWAERELKLSVNNYSTGRLVGKGGQEYYIITRPEQVYGFEFSSYIKSPDYGTLEDVVKSRIR